VIGDGVRGPSSHSGSLQQAAIHHLVELARGHARVASGYAAVVPVGHAAVVSHERERLPLRFLFFFLGAAPCTEWLDDSVARDENGFILTGPAAGADRLLETNVPGVLAAGDVRSGSTKRCATAVGEGAMAVQFVHGHLAASYAVAGGQPTPG